MLMLTWLMLLLGLHLCRWIGLTYLEVPQSSPLIPLAFTLQRLKTVGWMAKHATWAHTVYSCICWENCAIVLTLTS